MSVGYHIKGLITFDCERELYCFKWKNDNPNIIEALNEQGIMANCLDSDPDKAISIFREAIANGNLHAMINGFSVLWGAERYSEACEWLHEMNNQDPKNPKCLWNEAMLLFYGKEIEHNPMQKSLERAKSLLEQLVCHYYLYSRKYLGTIQESYIFMLKHGIHKVGDNIISTYESWKSMAFESRHNYSIKGNRLYNTLLEYHFEPYANGATVEDDYLNYKLTNFLDELYLKDQYRFGLEIFDPQGFFAYNKRNKVPLNKVLKGSICKMAAWQAYILYKAWRFLPLEDLDKNNSCRPIFGYSDLALPNFISEMPDTDYDEVISDLQSIKWTEDQILPNVLSLDDNKYQFIIRCTWWNDWRGLFREKVLIEFNPQTNIPRVLSLFSETLYPYTCSGRIY